MRLAKMSRALRRRTGAHQAIRSRASYCLLAMAAFIGMPATSFADEGGVSFWLPGLYGSLAAVPQQPGWTLAIINYYTNLNAGGNVTAAREITIGRISPTVTVNLNASLHANADLVLVNPGYVFATPILGGQLDIGVAGIVGNTHAGIDGTLTAGVGPFSVTRQGSLSDTTTGVGDLYPTASLRWNSGVNNWMTYLTGDIPVGTYSSTSLANLGIGHGAIDAGGGYTYFNPQDGHEFSGVLGLTYNFINPATQYQNGVDMHFDWGASQFLTKQIQIGAVGYVYKEIGCDSGSGDRVGCFQSQVFGAGPQVGYIFPLGEMQGYLNVKGYKEFAAENRPDGWNVWVTLAISTAAPEPAAAPRPLVSKY
jgi:hypothetical protein